LDRFGELKVFTLVAEARGFSSAARAAGLTPSAVSKLIARLESRLGVLLFHRSPRQVGLTREGERFYADACKILMSLDEAEAALAGDNAAATGLLRVYVLPSFARWQLAPLMPEFLAKYPSLSVELQLGNEPLRSLDSNIDIVIQGGRLRDSSLIARRIATSRWVLCASPDYLAKHGVPRVPEDLDRHSCLSFAVEGDWNTWMFRGSDGGLIAYHPQGRLASNHGDMLMAAAIAGTGIVRLTEFQAAAEIEAGRLIPLLAEHYADEEDTLYAIHHARRHISSRVRVFIDFLKARFHHPPWDGAAARGGAKAAPE
jgi:DNA-binding transcriptional LysR family regulator